MNLNAAFSVRCTGIYNNNVELFKDDLYKQVGKTVNGVAVNEQQLEITTENVVTQLQLTQEDTVIDLCCGNGLITRRVAKSVKKIIGVDFSERLIEIAKDASHAVNIDYRVENVAALDDKILPPGSKCYMYDALAFFSASMVAQVLVQLGASGIEKVMIGCVPDQEKLWTYYNTDEKNFFINDVSKKIARI